MAFNWSIKAQVRIFTSKTKSALVANTRRGLIKAAVIVEGEAKRLTNNGPPASLPGQPPHKSRKGAGNLQDSIKWAFVGLLTVAVGPSVLHGKFLEFGTKYMRPRPFMRPAITNSVSKFPKIFRGLL